MGRVNLLALALLLALAGSAGGDEEDWSKSPEAYFLTSEEKQEWAALDSRQARADFIERYWLKRDPSPGTSRNEFREAILGRIHNADQRYLLRGTKGSRTAQGFVFIVFGSPARVRQRHADQPAAPRTRGMVGSQEGTETLYNWVYDLERTRPILEFLKIPSLTIEILVEPQRGRDAVQQPGLVNEYRERLARGSIVNPDLVPARD